ncbi:MAG TPA: integrase arm-type DNA-binding domain-containing protein, partial [Pyrinomonadaceae bacterium]|nr:integrase arm-type DNA-binding domain-containing protein [Pyrinomonadaceae bacterium]
MGLTIVRCSSAKPQSKPYKLFDEKGMFLLVQPNGGKYWRMKYRFGGKEKLLALGVYPEVSLKKAREKRDQAKSLLSDRKDPSRLRRLELEAEKNTFESIAKEWVESRRNGWSKDHADRVLASLQRDVFPELGSRPVAKITPLELLGSLRKIESRGALEYADRLLQRCSAVFRYAIATGRCEGNPAAELRGALKTPKRQNYAAL